MSKIKTRENVKGVKLLDKSAVAGQRMKDAFIRSKRSAAALADNRQDTPDEYAGDTVEYAADDLIHDTANVAASGTKTAVRQGRNLFLRQREKKMAEQTPSPEIYPGTVPEEQPPQRYSAPTPEGRLPQQRTDAVPEVKRPMPLQSATERRLPAFYDTTGMEPTQSPKVYPNTVSVELASQQ